MFALNYSLHVDNASCVGINYTAVLSVSRAGSDVMSVVFAVDEPDLSRCVSHCAEGQKVCQNGTELLSYG